MRVYSNEYQYKLKELVDALNAFTLSEASKMTDVDKIFAIHCMDLADKVNRYLVFVNRNNTALKVEIK